MGGQGVIAKLSAIGRKLSPRRRQLICTVLAELAVLGAVLPLLVVFRSSVHNLMLETAKRQVQVIDLTAPKKLREAATVLRTGIAYEGDISTDAKRKSFKALNRRQLESFQIEFNTVVWANRTIATTANLDRAGEYWDPYGLVSQLLANPSAGQLVASRPISWSELAKEGSDVWRERVSTLQNTDFTHLYDTRGWGMVRYILSPIASRNTSIKAPLGVLVAGDVVNGKSPITYNSVSCFGNGGFGLYTRDPSTSRMARASSTSMEPGPFLRQRATTQSILEEDEPVRHLQEQLLLPAAVNKGQTVGLIYNGTAYAAKAVPNDYQGTRTLFTSDPAWAVGVRMLPLSSSTLYRDVLRLILAPLLIMLGVNLAMAYVGLTSFIKPLEDLAKKLKSGGKVDIAKLDTLALYKKFLVEFVLSCGVSLACTFVIYAAVKYGINKNMEHSVQAELGVNVLSYSLLGDSAVQGVALQASGFGPSLIANPTSYTVRNATFKAMPAAITGRLLSFMMVMDKDAKIVLSYSSVNRRMSEVYDPLGVISQTLSGNKQFQASGLMTFDELMREKPPVFNRHVETGVPDSNLSPYKTQATSLIRLVTCPIYVASNTRKQIPDGVFLMGDIVSGRTEEAERVLQVQGRGYAAIYIFDPVTKKPVIAQSVYRATAGGPYSVDVPIPDHVVMKCRNAGGRVVSDWATINGESYVFSVEALAASRSVDRFGPMDSDDRVDAYLVLGKPRSAMSEVEDRMKVLLAIYLVVQLVTMVLASYVAYLPLLKLLRMMEDKGFLKKENRPTVLRVLRVYCWQPTVAFVTDLRTKPTGQVADEWVRRPLVDWLKSTAAWCCCASRKSNKVHADRDSRATSGGSEGPSQAEGGRTSRMVSTSAAGGNSVASTSELQLTSARKAGSNVSSGSRPVSGTGSFSSGDPSPPPSPGPKASSNNTRLTSSSLTAATSNPIHVPTAPPPGPSPPASPSISTATSRAAVAAPPAPMIQAPPPVELLSFSPPPAIIEDVASQTGSPGDDGLAPVQLLPLPGMGGAGQSHDRK